METQTATAQTATEPKTYHEARTRCLGNDAAALAMLRDEPWLPDLVARRRALTAESFRLAAKWNMGRHLFSGASCASTTLSTDGRLVEFIATEVTPTWVKGFACDQHGTARMAFMVSLPSWQTELVDNEN
ncbi:MAG: hypothetical protein Q8O14_14635 [bacterium]|nr:hypothetical protein [bacterium]